MTLKRLCGLSALAAAALTAQPAMAQDSLESRIETLESTISDGARRLSFDGAMLTATGAAEELDSSSASAACAMVREQLTFDPYDGALRGARGAGFARGGNSLDRALFLGAMLDELGDNWRLASIDLDATQSATLLAGWAPTANYIGDAMPSNPRIYDAAQDMRHRGLVRAHYWVQVEDGDEWTDLDPTYPGLSPGEAVGTPTATYDAGTLPTGSEYALTLGVYYTTSGTDRGQVLEYSGRVDELGYRNLTLSIERNLESSGYEPTLNLMGQDIVGERIPATGLDRVWIELFFSFGGYEQRLTRDLFSSESTRDLLGVDGQVHSIVLLPGAVGPDYYRAVLGSFLGNFDERARTMVEASTSGDSAQMNAAVRSDTGLAMGIASLTFAHVSDLMAARLGAVLGVRPFYDRPRVVFSSAYRDDDTMSYRTDLRQNAIDAVPAAGTPWIAASAFQALRGRFDAELQQRVLSAITGQTAMGAPALFATAQAAGVSPVTVHLGNVTRIDRSPYAVEAQRRLTRDVSDSGLVAFTVGQPVAVEGSSVTAWWRVEPATGAVTGIVETGLAEAFTRLDPRATGPTGVSVIAQVVDLLQATSTTALGVGTGELNFDDVACDARCGLSTIADSICSGERRRVGEVDACLRGTQSSSDILQLSASCGTQSEPLICGEVVGNAVLSGELAVQGDIGGMGPFGVVAPLEAGVCVCR